jgi:hypothetical protein
MFYADRQTDRHEDMTKLIVDFYNFTNAHKMYFTKHEGN